MNRAIVIFNTADDSLSMKWKPGLILQLFKSAVNLVKARIISLSLLFFIAVVSMELQPYTYILLLNVDRKSVVE